MSLTQKQYKINLIVDANTNQLRSLSNEFKALEREIGRLSGKVDVMATTFNASQSKMQKSVRATANASKDATNMSINGLVRHIRQVESLAVAFYSVKKAYDLTLGRGFEFNKMMEQETTGLKLLIAQNLADVNSKGERLTALDKFTLAQNEANKALEIAKKINIETPHNLSETIQMYKLLTPQVLKYGGTLDEVGIITKRISILAAAQGVSSEQLFKTLDSSMSGQAKDSDLTRALAQFGLTNETIKAELKSGGSVVDLFIDKLKGVELAGKEVANQWEGITSSFVNEYDSLMADIEKPIFESWKQSIKDLTQYIHDNRDEILENVQAYASLAQSVIPALEGIAYAWAAVNLQAAYSKTNFASVLTRANMARLGVAALTVGIVAAEDETNSWTGTLESLFQYFDLGFAVITNIVWGFAKNYADVQNYMYRATINFLSLIEKAHQKLWNVLAQGWVDLTNNWVTPKTNKLLEKLGVDKEYFLPQIKYTPVKSFFDDSFKKDLIDTTYLNNKLNESYKGVIDSNTRLNAIKPKTFKRKTDIDNDDVKYNPAGDAPIDGAVAKKRKKEQDELVRQQQEAAKKLQEAYSKYTDIVGTSWDKFQEKLTKTMQELKNLPVDMRFEVRQKMTGEYEDTWMLKYYDEIGDKVESLRMKQKQVLEDFKGAGLFLPEDIQKIEASQSKEMAKLMKDQSKSFYDNLEELAESGNFGAILATKIMDSLEGLADSIRSGDMSSVGDSIGNVITSSANAFLPGLGTAIDLIGAIFSDIVSQSEIDAAKGRSDYSDNSISNSLSRLGDTAYPMLDATQKMSKYLRSMENNFGSVARAITGKASSAGIDLTGANYVNTSKVGFLGFSAKSVSLIGTGLQFQVETFENMMGDLSDIVQGYTSSLIQKSSWFGLKKKTYISTKYKDLPDSILNDISNAFSDGYNAILTAGVSLGFNKDNIAEILERATINLGKIDFTGLSSSEVSERFSSALGEALSGVVNNVSDFSTLIDRYNKSTENSLETLVRIATEYDQASYSFQLIGKSIIGQVSGFTRQMQVLDIVESTGGITNFTDAMDSLMTNFYSDSEQLVFMQKYMKDAFQTLGLAAPKTKDEFRDLLNAMDTSTESGAYLYGQVLLLSDSFAKMSKASESLDSSLSSVIQTLTDAWTGEYSPLSLIEKTKYATNVAGLMKTSTSATAVDTSLQALETAAKSARTQEEYQKQFFDYVQALEVSVPDATNTDIVNELKLIRVEIQQQTLQDRYKVS